MTRWRYDWVRDGMPAVVTIVYRHNHAVVNAEALSFRRLDDMVRRQFLDYFEQGMTPAAAAECHSNRLELDPDIVDTTVARADAAVNPMYRTIYHLYSKWRDETVGKRHGDGMWEVLMRKVEVYREAGVNVYVQRDPLCIALITPLMQRAHNLKSSRDVAFVDSTASCDAASHTVTFMLVTSAYGAVPVGVTITAGQSLEDYTRAFSALKTLLPVSAFCGAGHPEVFITDDSAAEKAALSSVWPEAYQKLCHFHVMQAVWRWLWAAKHGIDKSDRQPLMKAFRRVLYAADEDCAAGLFAELLNASCDYPNFQEYLQALWDRRHSWCMAYRHMAALRGHHTNNYAEVTVRLFKDNVLTRCKAYNAVALVDFMATVMERFYRNRLERYANGRVTVYSLMLEKLLGSCSYITSRDQIQRPAGTDLYHVPSQSVQGLFYELDAVLGVCSCREGMSGRCCKHQAAVYKFYNEALPNLPPVSAESRHEAAYVALGDAVPALDFYRSVSATLASCEPAQAELPAICSPVSSSPPAVVQTTSSITVEHSLAVMEENSERIQLLVDEKVQQISAKLSDLVKRHGYSADVLDSLSEFEQRMDSVSTRSQLNSLFHLSGQSVPRRYRCGAMIRVQPTATARRRPGITRGSKRVRCGRPADGEHISAKRPRCLSRNIAACVPNASSH
jgi:hypothetical protein